MIQIASVEPVWTRFTIPLFGVVIFAALATARQGRRTRVVSLVVLTVLLGLWLFGEGLVWSKRWPSMARGNPAWAADAGAWEWTGLLAVAYATVVAVALALRSFSLGRPRLGWACVAAAVVLFGAWSAVVQYSIGLGVITGGIALGALWAEARRNRAPAPTALSVQPRAAGRATVITATTVFIAFWLILALLWLTFQEGENVQCNCWADHRDAWQYTGQFLLAVAGSIGLAVAVGSYLRRKGSSLLAGGTAAMIALGAWIALYDSSRPPAHPQPAATTLPNVDAPIPRLEQPSAPGCPIPVVPSTNASQLDDPRSYYRPANFADALTMIEAHLGPDPAIEALDLSPDAVTVQYSRGDRERLGVVTPYGGYRDDDNGPHKGPYLAFRLSQASTNDPAGLIARIVNQADLSPSQIDSIHAIAGRSGQHFYWIVFVNSPRWEFFRARGATGLIQGFGPCGNKSWA